VAPVRRDALLAALFVAVFAVLTAALAAGGPLIDLDLAVREWAEAHRPPTAESVARILNRLGQGGPLLGICIVLALWVGLVRWRTPPPKPARAAVWWWALRPPLYVLAAAVLVVPTVLAVKVLTERGAPSSTLPPEQVVPLMGPLPPGEYDLGYPSGHAVNTIVWYGVLAVLVTCLLHEYRRVGRWPQWRPVLRIAPPLIVFGTQTYLSFHWLTDSLAGFALGLAVDRVLSLLRRLP
jgi:membrane-associated phospholipid phosphatase